LYLYFVLKFSSTVTPVLRYSLVDSFLSACYFPQIKYADALRRITVQASPSTNGPDLSYSQLEDIIRQTFKLPVSLELVITYTDMENDVVTMAGDQDLQDACVNQGLNPLRLQVTTVASSTAATPDDIPPALPTGINRDDLAHPFPTVFPFSHPVFAPAAAPAPPSASPVDDQSILSSKAPNVSAAPAAAPAPPSASPVDDQSILSSKAPNVSAAPAAAPAPPSASPVDDQSILSSKAPNVSAAPAAAPAPAAAAAAAQEEQPVFHYGVLCDMCNMTPIVGPRYKSLK
jgi:hypothetical protein